MPWSKLTYDTSCMLPAQQLKREQSLAHTLAEPTEVTTKYQ